MTFYGFGLAINQVKSSIFAYNILVSKNGMEVDDHLLLFISEIASLDVRPQVVDPAEAATLATSVETGKHRERSPTAMAMSLYVLHQLPVFFWRPRPLFQRCPIQLLAVHRHFTLHLRAKHQNGNNYSIANHGF